MLFNMEAVRWDSVVIEFKSYCDHYYFFFRLQASDGMTALHLAAKSGDLESVQCIMTNCRIDVNIMASSSDKVHKHVEKIMKLS